MKTKRKSFLRNTLICIDIIICILLLIWAKQFVQNKEAQSHIIQNNEDAKKQAEVKTMELDEVVDMQPVEEQKELIQQTQVEEQQKWKYAGLFKITAYCGCASCNGIWAGQPTATGTPLVEGRTVAVDPSVIPLGSTVMFDGHQYVAEDIGGGVKGAHIDLYMGSHGETEEWGVQYRDVYLYVGE